MFPIDFFRRAAQKFPDRPALVADANVITFKALEARVDALTAGFVALDPTVGSRVGICAGNSVEHLVALLAVLSAGKTWIPLNPRNGTGELTDSIAFTEPTIIVGDAVNLPRLVTGAAHTVGIGTPADAGTVAELERKHAGAARHVFNARHEDTQAIKFTGGTTGVPKGVMQPYRAWNTNIVTQMMSYRLTEDDRYLVVAPVTHGTSTYLLPILGSGGCLVFPHDTKPAGILDEIEQHRITTFFAPPTLIYGIMAEQVKQPRDTSSLRHLIYGGAPMRPDKIGEAIAIFGPVVATTYGQTEAPQIITFMSPQDFAVEARLASVGRASLMTELAILDAEGRRLQPGEVGEVCARGDLLMTGYWRMPEKTAETIRGGWLFTGDLGAMDEDGFLYLKDRSRDVIITGGFNVYPSDVENVLGRHPAVFDCSVVGIADDKWGEAVHAAVQLRPDAHASAEEIIAFVKEALGSVKAPKALHFLEALPKSPVQKVLKNAVKAEIEQRLAKR